MIAIIQDLTYVPETINNQPNNTTQQLTNTPFPAPQHDCETKPNMEPKLLCHFIKLPPTNQNSSITKIWLMTIAANCAIMVSSKFQLHINGKASRPITADSGLHLS
jgi:hypothetical protein